MFRFCPRAAASIAGLCLWLLALGAQQATAAGVDYDALEFRHGISQIPDYDLKYPHDFAHFDYVNPDAPKGGTLTVAVHGDSDVAKQVHIMGFIPIVPAHYWGERDVTQPTHEPPLQSGPPRRRTGTRPASTILRSMRWSMRLWRRQTSTRS